MILSFWGPAYFQGQAVKLPGTSFPFLQLFSSFGAHPRYLKMLMKQKYVHVCSINKLKQG